MNIRYLSNIIVIVFVGLLSASFASAQDGTRSITSDDFANKRPTGAGGKVATGPTKAPPRARYTLVKRPPTSIRWSKAPAPPRPRPASASTGQSEIGVTIWKLRPPVRTDKAYRLPVKVGSTIQQWTPERVSVNYRFRAGDRIRLAVESPVRGYLYLVNSEIGLDGSLGEPHLIFPESVEQNNMILPGMLVDIPDQREDLPYFAMNPKKENYAGEAIAVIVSERPLNIAADPSGKILDIKRFEELIAGIEFDIFARLDNKDKVYSATEAGSACGTKTRQLERVKTAELPCGTSTRQMTREEPLPQTIYRVKADVGKPVVAVVELRVDR